ncbi:hypothetical protein PHICD111_20037 [Clostridium phage phiCD111]|uniref:Uncharacterized protein n=2 Tax=root TaxID=1 RepID=A0A0A8WHU5_9CAUD|nr:hypothetical protein PHICD111_20037 [Clostridium phage phiCD111]CEK40313.1 protein of unknown function [Clostridium phage phiCD111]
MHCGTRWCIIKLEILLCNTIMKGRFFMRAEKIKTIVRKINFLDELGLEIVNNIGDLCIKDQKNKKKNNSYDLENIISIDKID